MAKGIVVRPQDKVMINFGTGWIPATIHEIEKIHIGITGKRKKVPVINIRAVRGI